ncbi:MAG: hypothetical protein K9G67_07590 [Bacteroidales bacterium]|nr:hypothetical protein [Bacteroidales bacterium]MCF8344989.1 hypothetical protein [Bacteroidales bacterium]MCF8350454.1 hypothetical protein [Bacteroidales bacterium]MCF8376203.1 hypothetical protein [Bacteroidales bacterium]MCF8401131.1 hypothetical protein [Bacteroidales bacterium]
MDIRDLKKEIEITFEALEEQVRNVLENEDKIPQIDMDILLGNLRKIYEDFRSLERMNNKIGNRLSEPKLPDPTQTERKKPEPEKQVEEQAMERKKTAQENTKERPVKEERIEQKETGNHDDSTKEDETSNQKQKQKTIIPEKQEADKTPPANKQQRMTADLFGDHTTLADKLMDKKDETLAARIKQNKIDDLKKAIGINEKFLFIHELFDGNMNEYNSIIEQLNSMASLEDANAFLERLKEEHDWSGKPSYLQLKKLVEKRY